jgi:transcription antitermination factor NusG
MRKFSALGYQIEAVPAQKQINAGDKIKIMSGALKNLEGIVLEENDENIFEIFLEGIGYNIRVRLPEGILKKVI